MNRISFLNRGYAFKGLLAVKHRTMIIHLHQTLKSLSTSILLQNFERILEFLDDEQNVHV